MKTIEAKAKAILFGLQVTKDAGCGRLEVESNYFNLVAGLQADSNGLTTLIVFFARILSISFIVSCLSNFSSLGEIGNI